MYKFKAGDLIITSKYHEYPGRQGILMRRYVRWGTAVWQIHWLNGPPYADHQRFGRKDTECEINLFNLRRRYHYYNEQGEYYESRD